MSDEKTALVSTGGLDFNFIQRNIQDISKTLEVSHTDEIEELYAIAYKNLKKHMEAGMPLAEEPALASETFKMMNTIHFQGKDSGRKMIDTLIKARVLADVPRHPRDVLLEDEDLPDEEVSEASVGEGGVFQKVADRGDPVLDI